CATPESRRRGGKGPGQGGRAVPSDRDRAVAGGVEDGDLAAQAGLDERLGTAAARRRLVTASLVDSGASVARSRPSEQRVRPVVFSWNWRDGGRGPPNLESIR